MDNLPTKRTPDQLPIRPPHFMTGVLQGVVGAGIFSALAYLAGITGIALIVATIFVGSVISVLLLGPAGRLVRARWHLWLHGGLCGLYKDKDLQARAISLFKNSNIIVIKATSAKGMLVESDGALSPVFQWQDKRHRGRTIVVLLHPPCLICDQVIRKMEEHGMSSRQMQDRWLDTLKVLAKVIVACQGDGTRVFCKIFHADHARWKFVMFGKKKDNEAVEGAILQCDKNRRLEQLPVIRGMRLLVFPYDRSKSEDGSTEKMPMFEMRESTHSLVRSFYNSLIRILKDDRTISWKHFFDEKSFASEGNKVTPCKDCPNRPECSSFRNDPNTIKIINEVITSGLS